MTAEMRSIPSNAVEIHALLSQRDPVPLPDLKRQVLEVASKVSAAEKACCGRGIQGGDRLANFGQDVT